MRETASERALRRIGARHVERATPVLYFDYDRQVWVKDGVYQDCGHPQTGDIYLTVDGAHSRPFPGCQCFGRLHAGEQATSCVKCYRVTTMHDDGAERSGIYDATSADEARTMVERAAAGVEDIKVTRVECLD